MDEGTSFSEVGVLGQNYEKWGSYCTADWTNNRTRRMYAMYANFQKWKILMKQVRQNTVFSFKAFIMEEKWQQHTGSYATVP